MGSETGWHKTEKLQKQTYRLPSLTYVGPIILPA